ncbi:hypothetical protein B0H19DRAFT_1083786 [Mycena capillaripes]|nr:hypothetical protein B0H19DRAFT_1083786 [Mycena capillaripes]
MLLIGAYIPPVSSLWQGWTDLEPLQKIWETVALGTQSDDKPIASLGDLNGRTGSLKCSSREVERAQCRKRVSADPDEKSTRVAGELLKTETSSPGRFTSWQIAVEWVIDYAIVSASLLPLVQKFRIEEPMENADEDWAEHMRICITFYSTSFEQTTAPRERGDIPEFAGSEYIDQLYQDTMEAKDVGIWLLT